MTSSSARTASIGSLDAPTGALVRLAAVIAVGSELEIREAMVGAAKEKVPAGWVEELLLQSYLFCGFPRGLNAMREWRRASDVPAPSEDEGTHHELADRWRARGEATCEVVYGDMYEALRKNIRTLHPALDSWMIVEGYGKVLSRPGLDLVRRELCIVAVCVAAGQVRQLHSHLHGAVNAGATPAQVEGTLAAIADLVGLQVSESAALLWKKVSAGNRRES